MKYEVTIGHKKNKKLRSVYTIDTEKLGERADINKYIKSVKKEHDAKVLEIKEVENELDITPERAFESVSAQYESYKEIRKRVVEEKVMSLILPSL